MTTASSSSDRDHVRDSGLLISGLHGSLLDADLRLSDQSDGMLDGLLDSKGSAVADFSFSSLQNSLASMSLDSRFEPLPVSDGGARPGKGPRQFQIDAVNFDPPAPRQPHRRASLSRRASLEDDMSVLSLQSAAAPPPSRDEQLKERQASDPKVRLQKLAESMERSEVTRRQVMAQRRLLSPEQQRALQEAKGRLDQEAQRHQDTSGKRSSGRTGSSGGCTSSSSGSKRSCRGRASTYRARWRPSSSTTAAWRAVSSRAGGQSARTWVRSITAPCNEFSNCVGSV